MVFRKLFSKMKIAGKSDSSILARYLDGPDLVLAKKIVKSGTYTLANQSWHVNSTFLEHEASYPQLYKKKPSEKFDAQITKINERLMQGARIRSYEEFASRADAILPRLFAPQIEGLDLLREALTLALFARDPIHILCLSDPQIGVDALVTGAVEFHPVFVNCDVTKLSSTDALWQGLDGKSPGVLAGAHQGIACLLRFEKLTDEQRKVVLQLIDRGFLTFNANGQVTRIPISARIFGVVNPLVDSFVGKDASLIKQQVPFDFSLVQHFHLTFLVQRSSLLRFNDSKLPPLPKSLGGPSGSTAGFAIAAEKSGLVGSRGSDNKSDHKLPDYKLAEADLAFIRSFVSAAEDRDVLFPKTFQPLIVEWTSKLKSRNSISYIHDITPNTIIAVIRLSQARARMKWRTDVALEDLKSAMDIVQTALEIR